MSAFADCCRADLIRARITSSLHKSCPLWRSTQGRIVPGRQGCCSHCRRLALPSRPVIEGAVLQREPAGEALRGSHIVALVAESRARFEHIQVAMVAAVTLMATDTADIAIGQNHA